LPDRQLGGRPIGEDARDEVALGDDPDDMRRAAEAQDASPSSATSSRTTCFSMVAMKTSRLLRT